MIHLFKLSGTQIKKPDIHHALNFLQTSTQSTESIDSFENQSSAKFASLDTKNNDMRTQDMNEMTTEISDKVVQEEYKISWSSGDETKVKEYGQNAERYTSKCASNHYVETLDGTSDRCIRGENRLARCKCDSRNSSQSKTNSVAYIHRNTDRVAENSLTERHVYESVPHGRNQHPFEVTFSSCAVPNDSINYLHPTTRVQSKQEGNILYLNRDVNNNHSISSQGQLNDFKQGTNDSSYACIGHCTGSSPLHQIQRRRIININKYKFFRKGFYVLSALNLIFLLLNVVGLPFLYVTMETDDSVKESRTCFKCNKLHTPTRQEMKDLGILRNMDGQCCVKTVEDLLAVLEMGWPSQKSVERNYKLINTLLTRHRSAIQLTGFVTNNHILWRPGGVNEGNLTYDEHGIHVNTGGTYYLYSKVGFKKGLCRTRRRIGYHVKLKRDEGSPVVLAAVQNNCLDGINYEQDFATQTIFQVPMGEKRRVFIDIASADYEFVIKHHAHTLGVIEI